MEDTTLSGTDYTLTPNLGLYKPVPDADSDAWGGHWNQNADKLDTAVGGGPFLPLSGGTVGPLARTNVSYDMLVSGAVGDGVTDDTAKIQAFLNTLPKGAEVVLPANHQFLIDSADLTVPMGLTIRAQGSLEAGTSIAGYLAGPAFILNPNYRIIIQSGVRLSDLKILRKGLLSAPTTAQSNAAVAAWAAEAPLKKTSASTASGNTLPFSDTSGITVGMKACGNELGLGVTVTAIVPNTSVTFSQVIGPYTIRQGAWVRFGNSVGVHVVANNGGMSLDRLFIMGFNTAILTDGGRIFIDTIEADCTMAMMVMKGGDASYISKIHCVPFYGGDWTVRKGPNFLLTRADGWLFEECSSVGWATGWVLSDVGGVTCNRCWMETTQDGVTVTTGFRTEGWITNAISLINCSSGGSVSYDFQHVGGLVNAVGCGSAASGAADPTAIGHYRLGAGSSGAITQAIVISGIQVAFIIRPGVGLWQVTAPCIYSPPGGVWFSGAQADIYQVSFIGGAQNGPLTLSATTGQTISLNSPTTSQFAITIPIGALQTFGFRNQSTGAAYGIYPSDDSTLGIGATDIHGTANNTWLTINQTGDLHPANAITGSGGTLRLGNVNSSVGSIVGGIEMYPGYGGFGVSAGTLNYNFTGTHQFLVGGTTPAMTIDGSGMRVILPAGFNNTAPIAKPAGWVAATGTATRSTFLTSSVTLPVLAEHVKALIDDLKAYGLI